ncbi:MAG: hypothetical protein IM624_07090 [Phenylobacterium sp.]|jgi:hypothetical protein|uniref:hypothetical protein n=1 Tax=Phenylobacterium sp. TaxID=1871053 RepID=UPI0025F8EE7B|nr:hypothetical protein [Phenylobacterium sp.]MCA6296031.1 hypothetical protein [Phenylobacterium sp.]MCA6298951.1 hypothetical protein [Phenylobacterium sp.]
MSALIYPVASDGEAALRAPLGQALRAREAEILAGEPVIFCSERVGPPCPTREAAQDLLAQMSAGAAAPPDPAVIRLVEVFDGARPPPPARPLAEGGRRWPAPPPPPRTVWRIQVDFWRPASRAPAILNAQARHVRKRAQSDLSGDHLSAFSRQPLRPVRPQQPLDIGLFEVRAPEDPDRLLPDE